MSSDRSGEPPSDIPSPDEIAVGAWADKESAVKEERNWSSLDDIHENNDKNWLKFYGFIVIGIAAIFTLIFLSGLVIWALHYMLPKCYLWLDPEQLSKIQSVLFSGGMGAVISSLIKRQMDRLDTSRKR